MRRECGRKTDHAAGRGFLFSGEGNGHGGRRVARRFGGSREGRAFGPAPGDLDPGLGQLSHRRGLGDDLSRGAPVSHGRAGRPGRGPGRGGGRGRGRGLGHEGPLGLAQRPPGPPRALRAGGLRPERPVQAAAGPGLLLALGLLALLPGRYRLIFLLAALPGAAAVWLTFRLRDAAPERAADGTPAPRLPLREALRGLPREYWRALALLGLFAFANSTDALLLLRAKSLGFSDVQAVAAYVLFNLTYALSAYPAGVLSDRFGRWRMMLGGWTLYALVYFGFALAGPGWIWGLFPLYGLYMGCTEGVGKALVASTIPAERRGAALGFFLMVTGLSTLAGSLAAGLAWDVIGPRAPFILGGTAALLAVAAGLAVIPRGR
ncbi:MFS transporter [Desulfovibrio aminophilus]|nr:MFS transporter [Desulfovibrio aminophilus]MCM0756495.1 MFS transporter [Desulfovibrio aminophilus]